MRHKHSKCNNAQTPSDITPNDTHEHTSAASLSSTRTLSHRLSTKHRLLVTLLFISTYSTRSLINSTVHHNIISFTFSTYPSHFFFFFLNNPAPPEISPFPLHDPLPISDGARRGGGRAQAALSPRRSWRGLPEHDAATGHRAR